MKNSNSNLFISQNTDLIIMLFAGCGIYLASLLISEFSFVLQLVWCASFGLIAGLFAGRATQVLEWNLCFFFGGIASASVEIGWPMLLSQTFAPEPFVPALLATSQWFGFLLGPLTIGLILGSTIGHSIIGDYWSQKSICS